MATERLPREAYVPQEHYGVDERGRPTHAAFVGDPRYAHRRPEELPPIPGKNGPVTAKYNLTDPKVDDEVLRMYEELGGKVEKKGYYANITFQADRHAELLRSQHELARLQMRSVSAPVAGTKAMPAETVEVSSADL